MGKIEKKHVLAKSNHEEQEEEEDRASKLAIVLSSDDEEADKDLSLEIVEKAMLRNTGGNNLFLDEAQIITDVKDDMKQKKKKEKNKKIKAQEDAVDVARKEKEVEAYKPTEADTLLEMDPVEKSDNAVLRKLLRGPRYFDPPDSSWGACYNCGEGGHMTANCTSAKRKKPCFVCGSLEHNAKQCKKGKDCFICQKGGHRAKDCPEKSTGGSQSAKICLNCGDSGHDMFSCKNIYSSDDLKEVQCYVCKCFGHLCCVNYTGAGPREVSCYRCGQSGHTGLACTRLHAETTGMGSPSSCYRCGEEGHFARECASSVKIAKRNCELSNPKRKRNYSEGNRNQMEIRSAPHDIGKARKRKKTQYEGVTSSSKSKQRGGWITEDPGDFLPDRKYIANGWRSPATPTNYNNKIPSYSATGGHASSSRYGRKLQFGNSASNGSTKVHQHRFSASRFGNSSSYGMREYDWQ